MESLTLQKDGPLPRRAYIQWGFIININITGIFFLLTGIYGPIAREKVVGGGGLIIGILRYGSLQDEMQLQVV